jgi:hypothetical protein
VDRGKLTGKPIEMQDADDKLQAPVRDAVTKLFKGNTARQGDHMGNFFEAFMHGKHPISDVVGQHRVVSACHLANISIRLGRKLQWNPQTESFVGDNEANQWLKREPRKGYEFAS